MHCDLFPTRIYVEQNFLESEEFDEIKLLVKKDKEYLDVPDFAKKVAMHMETICDDLGVDFQSYDSIQVTETWGNVLNKGDGHPVHTHSNHVFSGVFYLTDGNPTIFMDPRPAETVFL